MSLTKKRYSKGYHLEVNSKRNLISSEINESTASNQNETESHPLVSASKDLIINTKIVPTDETIFYSEIKPEIKKTSYSVINYSKPNIIVTKKETISNVKLSSIIKTNNQLYKKKKPPFWFDNGGSAGAYIMGSIGAILLSFLFFFLFFAVINGSIAVAGLILTLFGIAIIVGLVILVLVILNAD